MKTVWLASILSAAFALTSCAREDGKTSSSTTSTDLDQKDLDQKELDQNELEQQVEPEGETFTSAAAGQDGYYMVLFAQEGPRNEGLQSHTFATFVSVSGSEITENTISYLPQEAHLPAPLLRAVPGQSHSIENTLRLMPSPRIFRWGPFRITPELYQRAMTRLSYLNSTDVQYFLTAQLQGVPPYRVRAYNQQRGGVANCITAVSDLVGLYQIPGRPGLLNPDKPWGSPATRDILRRMAAAGLVETGRVYTDIEQRLRLRARFQVFGLTLGGQP